MSNGELRCECRDRLEEVEADLRRLRDFRIGLEGEKGDNGRLGVIREDVKSLKGDRSKFIAGILGSLLFAGIAIYQAGVKRGVEESEMAGIKAELREQKRLVQRLLIDRFSPVVVPAPVGDDQ